MKNTVYFFICLFFALTFSSCQENSIVFPNVQSSIGSFEVTIDGQVFSTENVTFTSDNQDIFINAFDTGTNEIFTVKVNDFAIGGFSFEGGNTVASYVQNNLVSADVWTTINATSSRGNIDFTDIDFIKNTVSGTFSFIGENAITNGRKAFSNGSFKNVPKDVLPVSNNKFTAKVDGLLYEDISLFGTLVTIGRTELITINANKSLSETIGISLESNITVGEYDFGSFITQTYPTGQYNVGGSDNEADGKIIITTHDTSNKLIIGTFEFEASPITSATPSFSITEGSFSISY